jgi:3-carboxy-cis,cis-muconate cycloisomerase
MDGPGHFGSAADGDVGLLSPVSASPLVTALTGDRAVLAAILAVESGWAAVLEKAGLAPAGSAAVVASAAEAGRYDAADIALRAQGGGNPVIPLLADLRKHVAVLDAAGIGAVKAVHTSLTSQDVLDTALMLLARNTVEALLGDLKCTTAALATLAEQHADTLGVGRSLTQHSLPFTFGLRAAQWFHGVAAAGRQLENVQFPVQFGGAAGTLAAGTVLTAGSATNPFDLADSLARQLGHQLGRLEGGAADEDRQHRVLLLRHGRGDAASGGARFGEFGHLGPAQEQDVGGDLAGGIQHRGQRAAQGCDG